MENKEIIKITGKVAKFPKNTRADDALKMMETIKINPNKLWYILIESQDDTLKMVKYNQKEGVNLKDYTNGLKTYYTTISPLSECEEFKQKINLMEVIGEDAFSVIKNIPTDIILENGMTLLSKIANDLILLLNNE